MKQLTVIFTILTALLLATSCSKDELPGSESTDEPGQPQTYTFTVSPDLMMIGDAGTRSAGTTEEMPTRCFMQILKNDVLSTVEKSVADGNGSFTFSVKLLSNTNYTFLFWADNNSNGEEPEKLTAIQYTPGTVAFTAKVVNTPENMIENGIILKHVVTKLSLKTTAATSASEEESIKVTTTCATTYNVDDPSASSYSEQTVTKTFDTSTGFEANNNIATFYFIPKSETQNVDVEFHLLKQTIENVSLAANTHVTLQGDLSESSSKWEATNEYIETKFRSYFFDGNQPKGEYFGGNYCFNNGNAESITALFMEITRSNSFQIPEIGTSIRISNNLSAILMYSNDLYIFFNDVDFCIYLIDYNSSYPDFSDIYPGTNIN